LVRLATSRAITAEEALSFSAVEEEPFILWSW
jgi:hypothetical protein